MSIVVQDLVKYYGSHKALDSISFSAEPGTILGFLGPNGAGKSTTMKILAGFLPSASGKVLISGLDIETHSYAARAKIGYLPENNPLYPDMYISEFLTFVANIYKIKARKQAVSKVIDQTGLEAMKGKKIGSLSKGFRQRVGLAGAIIGNPEVLILDEPTSGLDPNQLSEIRSLISELGKEKTVLFSTHIMQEVESICDRVVILNKGKIVANDSVISILESNLSGIIFLVEFDAIMLESDLRSLPEVIRVIKQDSKDQSFIYEITTQKEDRIRQNLFDLAVKQNRILLGLKKVENDLSNIFSNLTKP